MNVIRAKEAIRKSLEHLMSLPKDRTNNSFIWLYYRILNHLHTFEGEEITTVQFIEIINEQTAFIVSQPQSEPFHKKFGEIVDYREADIREQIHGNTPIYELMEVTYLERMENDCIKAEKYEQAQFFRDLIEKKTKD